VPALFPCCGHTRGHEYWKVNAFAGAWLQSSLVRSVRNGRALPVTQDVQGWFADDVSATEGETYEPVTCLACRQTHFVNRSTGRTLGDDEG
jgi:hypothetical protein